MKLSFYFFELDLNFTTKYENLEYKQLFRYFGKMEEIIANALKLTDFLSSKRCIHSEEEFNFDDALRFLDSNMSNTDMITYKNTRHFKIFNVGILEIDKDGRCFHKFKVESIGDIIDQIEYVSTSIPNVIITYEIGGFEYTHDEIEEYVFVSSTYNTFMIKITFLQQPNVNDEFMIKSRYYLLQPQDRVFLAKTHITTKNNIYVGSMCGRKK